MDQEAVILKSSSWVKMQLGADEVKESTNNYNNPLILMEWKDDLDDDDGDDEGGGADGERRGVREAKGGKRSGM